jgi:hypothetical protein
MKMTRAEIQKRYKDKNKDKVNEIQRNWRRRNSEQVRATRAANRRKRYANNRKLINDYKANKGCNRCPVKIPCCLEFHHSDPSLKEAAISDMLDLPWHRIESEILKCEVVCRNCHAIIHDEKLGDTLPRPDYSSSNPQPLASS